MGELTRLPTEDLLPVIRELDLRRDPEGDDVKYDQARGDCKRRVRDTALGVLRWSSPMLVIFHTEAGNTAAVDGIFHSTASQLFECVVVIG